MKMQCFRGTLLLAALLCATMGVGGVQTAHAQSGNRDRSSDRYDRRDRGDITGNDTGYDDPQGNRNNRNRNNGDEYNRNGDEYEPEAQSSNRGFTGRIRTDHTQYGRGGAVQIFLSLTNNGRSNHTLSPGGNLEYDITIREDRTDRIVWQLSKQDEDGRRARVRSYTIGPGQARRNREFWDMRDNKGRWVPGGTYRVEAHFYPGVNVSTKIFLSTRPLRPQGSDDRYPSDEQNGSDYRQRTPGAINPRPISPAGPSGRIPRPTPRIENGGDGIDGTDNNERRGNRDTYGSTGGNSRDSRDISGDDLQAGSVVTNIAASLRVDQSDVRAGGSVRLTYTVVNRGRQRQVFNFASARQAEFEAGYRNTVAPGNPRRVIWNSSDETNYAQVVTSVTLEPGEARTFNATWRVPTTQQGGSYDLVAYLTPMSGSESSWGNMARAVARLTVRNSNGNRNNSDLRVTARPGDRGDRIDEGSANDTRPISGGDGGNNDGRIGGRFGSDGPTAVTPTTGTIAGSSHAVSVGTVLRDSDRYMGRRVTVTGAYHALSSDEVAPVRGATARLEDTDGEVYISVLNTRSVKREGQRITVSGVLRRNRESHLYLASE